MSLCSPYSLPQQLTLQSLRPTELLWAIATGLSDLPMATKAFHVYLQSLSGGLPPNLGSSVMSNTPNPVQQEDRGDSRLPCSTPADCGTELEPRSHGDGGSRPTAREGVGEREEGARSRAEASCRGWANGFLETAPGGGARGEGALPSPRSRAPCRAAHLPSPPPPLTHHAAPPSLRPRAPLGRPYPWTLLDKEGGGASAHHLQGTGRPKTVQCALKATPAPVSRRLPQAPSINTNLTPVLPPAWSPDLSALGHPGGLPISWALPHSHCPGPLLHLGCPHFHPAFAPSGISPNIAFPGQPVLFPPHPGGSPRSLQSLRPAGPRNSL
uniref:uncharacterized protein LOC114680142 n=1 Tax=Macaca mulatta TaxID=9544 RepID=UPI0010A2695B|nr:uncharacterized protein LOC114680142 [Macaca mulatta]